jgi:hypothetical protein
MLTKHLQVVQHVLYDGQNWFKLSFNQFMATCWAVCFFLQPCFDADFTEHMTTWALHCIVQYTLANRAYQFRVWWSLKLAHVDIKARHTCNRVYMNKKLLHGPVRIRVTIDPSHPLVCRKRRLNAVVLRMRPEKPRSRVTAGVAR